MNILVVGCGKVGSRLASVLSEQGHDVSVIDSDPENFDMLSANFRGMTLQGVPIDLDVLKRAGIEGCDAVAAVTQDDNINIMVSQLAREIFKIKNVIARIYDPNREDVFSHFGLRTVCPTNLTVFSVCNAITNQDDARFFTIDSSTLANTIVPLPKKLVGRTTRDIEGDPGEMLLGVLRKDGSIRLNSGEPIELKETDRLVFTSVVD